MTNDEYRAAYALARKQAASLSFESRAQIAKVYRKAAEEAAAVVRRTLERGLSTLTVERWSIIESQLRQAAEDIVNAVDPIGRKLVSSAVPLFPEIDRAYLLTAVSTAGAGNLITEFGMGRMIASVNRRLVESLTTRIWADGYTFSKRVWNLQDDWLERIKMTVSAGLAQGRDPVKIAKDIQVYTADGKVALVNRWGKLERGTAEFAKRIPGQVDWRAARIVRSELYASLQDAGVAAGEVNPGCTGEYDWLLSAGRADWNCTCAELAASGPYTKETIPDYPHSQCECTARARLRDRREFVADLKKWGHGESVDYLDKWYTDKYKGAE